MSSTASGDFGAVRWGIGGVRPMWRSTTDDGGSVVGSPLVVARTGGEVSFDRSNRAILARAEASRQPERCGVAESAALFGSGASEVRRSVAGRFRSAVPVGARDRSPHSVENLSAELT